METMGTIFATNLKIYEDDSATKEKMRGLEIRGISALIEFNKIFYTPALPNFFQSSN